MDVISIIKNGLEQFGLYYGKYPGYIISHSKINPQMVLLKVPEVWGNKIHYDIWAKPAHFIGGYNWGEFGVPQVGDMVWVEFRLGSPGSPIWTPAYNTDREKPKEFKNSRTYGFKTPHGSYYTFEDDLDLFTFQHRWLDHDSDPNNILMVDGCKITIDKDHVIINHLDHEVKLTPDDIIINTKQPININSEKEINVSSKEDMNITSTDGKINLVATGAKGTTVPVVDKLVEKINNLENALNGHKHTLTSIPVVAGTTSVGTATGISDAQLTDVIIPLTTEADIENENITQ